MNNITLCTYIVTLLSKKGWYDSAVIHANSMNEGFKKAVETFEPLGYEVIDIITDTTPYSYDLASHYNEVMNLEEKNNTIDFLLFEDMKENIIDNTEAIRFNKSFLYMGIRYQYGAY